MKKNSDYIKNFDNAYKSMKNRATEIIKDFGKTLEVEKVLQNRMMKDMGWITWPLIGSKEMDAVEEEIEEWKYNEMFWCAFEGKHEQINSGYISMVRWNTEKNEIEIFFNSNDGYISEWLPETYIEFDREAIYKTILEFTD